MLGLSKTSFQTAWATVIHMSHEGGGMKLRDLARGSRDPTSLLPAFHILRARFGNQETARGWRRSYESVHRLTSTTQRLLTLLQQTTMVLTHKLLRRPRHSGSPGTVPIRTYNGDQNFRKRTCHRPAPLYPLILNRTKTMYTAKF